MRPTKLPCTWDDRTLLEDEPFFNAFSARAKQRGIGKRNPELWRTRVLVNLRQVSKIDKVLKRWRSLLPGHGNVATDLRQEEIIDVFFDFYYHLSDDVAPKIALEMALRARDQRRAKTDAGSSLQAVTGQQVVETSIPGGKGISSKARNSLAHCAIAGTPRTQPKHAQRPRHEEHATPRRGRTSNALVVKTETRENDNNLLQKSSSTKRRPNESLPPRSHKKRRLDAPFDGTSPQTGKRPRETKPQITKKDGPRNYLHELPDRKSRLRARPCPQPTYKPEQKVLTRQMKQERMEDIPLAQTTQQMDIKSLPSKVVLAKTKRPIDDSDELDSKFDKNFSKRKRTIGPLGRTIPSDAPVEPIRKKKRRKPKKRVKLEEGLRTLDLQDTRSIPLEATNPTNPHVTSAKPGNRSLPSSSNAVAKTASKVLPASSTKDTGIWNHRLRNRGPVSPKNVTYPLSTPQVSRKSRPSKPSKSASTRTTPANSHRVATTAIYPQDETSPPENLASEAVITAPEDDVEAKAEECDRRSNTALPPECLGTAVALISNMDIGPAFPAQDVDDDERTETISEFSSPLALSPRILPGENIPFPETQQPGLPVADEGVPYATDNYVLPFAGPEKLKTMNLVSEAQVFTMPLAAHVSAPEPAETSQPLEMKPPLPVLPSIWAESRQEVCETFDWFRSYQGGVYHVDDYVKGYLLSGFPASRDRFEHGGKFIISHGGGRAESLHSSKGNCISMPASDQLAADKSVRALINNYIHNRPLALLIDDKYALFPYDLGSKNVAYAVLGFYKVAYAWAEYQTASNELGRVVRYKFAFRWCEEQGEPWWTKLPSNGDTTDIDTKPSPDHQNDRVLEQLASACDRLALGRDDATSPVSKASANGANPHPGVIPDIEAEGPGRNATMRCQICHKESPKVFSISWACLNPDCSLFWRQTQTQLSYLPPNLAYEPRFLQLQEYKNGPLGFADLKLTLPVHESFQDPGTGATTDYHFTRGLHCKNCGRLSCRSQWERWECLHCGSITKPHIPIRGAGDLANQSLPISFDYYFVNDIAGITTCPTITYVQQGGRGYLQSFILPYGRTRVAKMDADAIFKEYQEEAVSGRMKFRRWPMRAHKCRGALLTNYFSHNAGEPYKYVGGDANTVSFDQAPAVCKARDLIQKRIRDALGISSSFNEVLSAAYMERQRMAFHSDNEVGLGPLVAGLSLGSPALMHFRIHARHDPQREQRGILLSVVLRHGDVLVMDGAGVQDFYEHTVVPNNFRIAATARQIGATHS